MKEDRRFLTGRGTYVDDINRPNQTWAVIVRSPHAHARIKSIDTSAATAAPGVVAVFTGADMQVGGLPCGWQINNLDGGPGDDLLDGGDGNDVCTFEPGEIVISC